MLRSRLFVRLATWAAFVAILMAALAPTLSHALASRGDAGWVEVCTAEGSRWVQGSGPGEPAAPAGTHALDHCGYCTLHNDDPALPTAGQQAEAVPAAAHALPIAFLRAARTAHAWVSAQPRAPPVIS